MNDPTPPIDPAGAPGLPPLDVDYLLIVPIPFHPGPDGRLYVEPLWAKDIAEHVRYLPRLAIAAPAGSSPPPEGFLPVPEGARPIPLAPARSRLVAAATVLPDALRLWRAIGRARIVHYGVAGWPYPAGWLAAPIARLRRRKRVVIVESAPWRTDRSARPGSPRRLIAALYEAMARRLVRSADIAIFTQSEYRDSMLGDPSRGWIIPASWIDEEGLLSPERAERDWDDRPCPPGAPLALGFAGRLVAEKGVAILLEALRLLDRRDPAARVTVELYGAGPLLADCERLAAELRGPVRLRVRGVLPYGPAFFEAIRPLHAVLIPSLGDEQPRIVYDAWSQAVPFLGSDTAGLRDGLAGGAGGLLVPPGDPAALADAIAALAADPAPLRAHGIAGLARARALTHQEIHRRRRRIFAEVFEPPAPGPTAAPEPEGIAR